MYTYAETHVNSSAVTPGAAANADEDGKRRMYAALSVTVLFRFEQVAQETAGVFGNTTEVLLKKTGRRMLEVTGECREAH